MQENWDPARPASEKSWHEIVGNIQKPLSQIFMSARLIEFFRPHFYAHFTTLK